MKVTLVDSPSSCLESLDEEETLMVFRAMLLNDFKPLGEGHVDGSLSPDEHICNMRIKATDDG